MADHFPNRRKDRTASQRKRSAGQPFPHIPLPLREGTKGRGNCHLLRVNRYSTPIAAWQTTQISSAVLKAAGPREASG